jgi:predicted MFS family arabinose efflux permease
MRNWKRYPYLVLAGLLVLHVLAHIDRNMLLGFSPQIIPDLGLSNTQYGFLTGAVWVLSFGIMAVFLGSLADRFSRTRVIAFGVFIWSVCTTASGFAHSFEQMALARFFVATGEAALVPAAVSLLAEVFPPARRGAASGIFFIGIPVGIGLAFVVAGWLGDSLGWRGTFKLLGAIGVTLMIPLLLAPDRAGETAHPGEDGKRGAPFLQQLRDLWAVLRITPVLRHTIVGFILVHFVFAALSFLQLWLVQERDFVAGDIARKIGLLQILFGTLGAVVGGVAGDRLARRFAGGHATVLTLMVLVCVPLMVTTLFVPAGSTVLFLGLCAGFFLMLACYGPSLALLQALAPRHMWATTMGLTMLGINVFAIAIGNLVAGATVDYLRASGATAPLTTVLLALNSLVGLSLLFFWRVSRSGDERLKAERDTSVVAH